MPKMTNREITLCERRRGLRRFQPISQRLNLAHHSAHWKISRYLEAETHASHKPNRDHVDPGEVYPIGPIPLSRVSSRHRVKALTRPRCSRGNWGGGGRLFIDKVTPLGPSHCSSAQSVIRGRNRTPATVNEGQALAWHFQQASSESSLPRNRQHPPPSSNAPPRPIATSQPFATLR